MSTHKMRETAMLTADVVALAWHKAQLHVLLVERRKPPYQSLWALPGGHLDPGETFEQAARRELAEETGVTVTEAELESVAIYSTPGRDPRGRYVSAAYVAVLDHMPQPTAGDDARLARWLPIYAAVAASDTQPARIERVYSFTHLAFDHRRILADAIDVIRDRVFGGGL